MKLSATCMAIIAAVAFLASRSCEARRISNALDKNILQAQANNSISIIMNNSMSINISKFGMKGPHIPTPQLCYEFLTERNKLTMPNLLPDHPTCHLSAPKDFLRHWIICPSRGLHWLACSFYCPTTGMTLRDPPTEDECPRAQGLEPTPGRCNDPTRGVGAHLTPAYLPFKPRRAYTHPFVSKDSCKHLDNCKAGDTYNCQNKNWVRCPSRGRHFEECSYFCPSDASRRTYKTVAVGSHPVAQCIMDRRPSPSRVGGTFFKKTITQGVCMQVDVMGWGGIIGVNFAVGADISLITPAHGQYSELTIEGFIGGGLTLGLILIQGSVYVEGHIAATLRIPPSINGIWRALHYAVSLLFDVVKRKTKLGKVITRWQEKRKATRQEHKIEKIVELHATIWNAAGYREEVPVRTTPFYCRLPTRKNHKNIPSHIKIQDDSCTRDAIGTNWIRCPKINSEHTKCDYFCPQTGKTVKTKETTTHIPCPQHMVMGVDGAQVDAGGTALTVGKGLRTDARLLLSKFLDKLYGKATQLEGFLSHNPPMNERYINEIERSFRWAYFLRGEGEEPNVCHGLFCWPGSTVDGYGKINCKTLAQRHLVTIGPLMCEIVQRGFLLGTAAGSDSRHNLRSMLFVLFPRILPRQAEGAGLDHTEALKFVREAKEADNPDINTDTNIDHTLSFVSGITGLFSYPPEQILLVLKGMTEANTDFDTQNIVDRRYYEPWCHTREFGCQFGFKDIEFTTVFGVTLGGSKVGFCTPDANTFQLQRTWKGTRVKGDGAEVSTHIMWEDPMWTTTIALSIYVAGAITFESGYASAGRTRRTLAGLQFRFRFPLEFGQDVTRSGDPIESDEETYTSTLKSIKEWIDDNNIGWTKNLVEKRSESFFKAALGGLSGSTDQGFFGTIGQHLGKQMMSGHRENMMKWLATNVFDKPYDITYKRSNLIGFDVTYEKSGVDRSTSITLVQHRYSEIDTKITFNPGLSLTIMGYEGTEIQFEGTRMTVSV